MVSISPTFYEQLLHTKVICKAFMYLQFGFVICWQKEIGAKAARKMLVKLTAGVEYFGRFAARRQNSIKTSIQKQNIII